MKPASVKPAVKKPVLTIRNIHEGNSFSVGRLTKPPAGKPSTIQSILAKPTAVKPAAIKCVLASHVVVKRSPLEAIKSVAMKTAAQKFPPTKIQSKIVMADPTVEKLKLELHRSRLDNEASERRISRLVRKVEDLEYSKDEAESLKIELDEMDAEFHTAVLENSELKKKLARTVEGQVQGIKAMDDGLSKQERDVYVAKINELNTRIEMVSGNYNNWIKQLRNFQQELMDALGISDNDLRRNIANGGIGESSKSCGPVKLHRFLRSSVENLRSEYNGMVREVTNMRSQFHQDTFKAEALAKEVETLRYDKKKTVEGLRKHESQIEYLTNEIKLLSSFLNDDLNKETETKIKGLQTENDVLNQKLTKLQVDCDVKVENIKRDLELGQERYELLEAQGVVDRKDIENRWQKLWEVHSQGMKDDFDTLKKNYETPLVASHEREASLQVELNELQERYNNAKVGWEEYRLTLFNQMQQWKEQYLQKCKILDELRTEKSQLDSILDEKEKDIELFQTMINDGVEERQNLQKKVETLQVKLREMVGLKDPAVADTINGTLSPSCSWFSIGDFKKLRERMLSKSQSQLKVVQEEDKEKKRLHNHN